LLVETPEAAALGAVGVFGLLWSARLRGRWMTGLAGALATLAFLVAGDVRDGAPTHHPERALSSLWWVLIGMGIDAIFTGIEAWKAAPPRLARGVLTACALTWLASLPSRWSHPPGANEADRRDGPIARGLDMRRRGVEAASITPCAFEHFALIAAWGRPEGARVLGSLHRPPTAECPLVEER
jgi:hypothetical protein